jgi:hypothetical protein
MDGTLGDLFRVVAAGTSSLLLPESQLAHLLQVADLLPPSSVAGFERSLGRDPIAVDFAIHFRTSDPCGRALTALAHSGQLDAVGWSELAGLFREIGRHGSALAGRIDDFWLEFDTSIGDSRPSLFVSPKDQDAVADVVVALAAATGSRRPEAQALQSIRRLSDLPGRVFQIGLLLARADDAIRLCINNTGVGGMGEILEALGGSRSWLIPRLKRDSITGLAHVAFLAFDLTPNGIRHRIGVELIPRPSPNPDRLAGWRRMLEALHRDGLCYAAERDDLIAFCGETEETDCPHLWPENLSGFPYLPAGPVPVLNRRLHHVKLSLGDTPLRAKVYFGFLQSWRYCQPAQQT